MSGQGIATAYCDMEQAIRLPSHHINVNIGSVPLRLQLRTLLIVTVSGSGNTLLINGTRFTMDAYGEVLLITDVRPSDAGTYQCHADNKVPRPITSLGYLHIARMSNA